MRQAVIILTPMDTEQRAATRALARAGFDHARVIRTGIGAVAVVAALSRELGEHAASRGGSGGPVVILFGVGGALCELPDGPCVNSIITESGLRWTPPLSAPLRPGESPVTVVGVDRLVPSPDGKRALHLATGAHIVDMESHAFADAASSAGGGGLRWGVVRGVSDGPGHMLPKQTLNWITPEGVSRPGRFMRDVALRPWLIPGIARTMPQVFRGLNAGAARLVELIRSLEPSEARA